MQKKIELSKNEKRLLVLLILIIVFCFFYRMILLNQKEKIKKLEKRKTKYEKEVMEAVNILKEEEEIEEDYMRLNREKRKINSQYFLTLEQSEIIYLLNDILNECELKILDINFSEPSLETINKIPIKNMGISIFYQGSYNELLQCIKKIKKSPKKFLITELIMDREDKEFLVGEIKLKAFSLEGILKEKGQSVAITTPLNMKRENPFSCFQEYGEKENENHNNQHDDQNEKSDANEKMEEIKILKEDEKQDIKDEKSTKYLGNNTNEKPIRKTNTNTSKVEQNNKEMNKAKSYKKNRNIKNNSSKGQKIYLDLNEKNIEINHSDTDIKFYLYSYSYLPIKLSLSFLGQNGEKGYMRNFEKIDKKGWNYIYIEFPKDCDLYPLKLDKLYFEIDKDSDSFGFVFIDNFFIDDSNN